MWRLSELGHAVAEDVAVDGLEKHARQSAVQDAPWRRVGGKLHDRLKPEARACQGRMSR